MTLIGHTMMCEQAGPKQLTQKVAAMQQLSDGRFTPVGGRGESQRIHRRRATAARKPLRGDEALQENSPPAHDSDRSRSTSAIPRSGRITLRSSAGVSVTTTSSVGNTRPSRR
jgi:hypothetical protein